MSKKRKEELEHNELADRLEEQFEKWKPYLPIIGAVVGIIVVLICGGVWYYHNQKAKRAAVWKELGEAVQQSSRIAGSTSALDSFAENNPDTDAALWAKFFAGDIEIKNAILVDQRTGKPAWLADKKKSKAGLTKAKKYLVDVVNSERKMDKMLRRRATFALAYAHESLGEFDDAKKYYDELVEEGDESPLYDAALLGSKRCKSKDVSEFYTMFDSWDTFGEAPGSVLLPRIPDIEFTDEIKEPIGGGSFDPTLENDPAPKPGAGKTGGQKPKNKGEENKSGENKSGAPKTEGKSKSESKSDKSDKAEKKSSDKKTTDKKSAEKKSDK